MLRNLGLCTAICLCAAGADAAGEDRGSTRVELDLRTEAVSDDRFDEDALANTLRTIVRVDSPAWRGWRAVLEAENVAALGNGDLFNNAGAGSAGNGVTDRPVVADADSTEINQAFLQIALDGNPLRIGRQELVFGDQRFVGPVGWRRNHQSFDAVSIDYGSLSKAELRYALVGRVNRIFGDSQGMLGHLLNVRFDAGSAGKVTAYAYLLDYDAARDAPLSTSTLGVEWSGDRPLERGGKMLFELEAARQSDYADNPGEVDAGYHMLMVGHSTDRWGCRLGWERLEGSPTEGSFRTPLATLHKFNGWADRFLVTPANGLDDYYLQLTRKIAGGTLTAVVHDFQPVQAGPDFGRELDLQWVAKTTRKLDVGVKAALFDGAADTPDTDKLMAWVRWRLDKEWSE